MHTECSCQLPRVGWTRAAGLLIALPCWAALLAASLLTPAAAGHGTHEQWGLPPCSMLINTGWPCPTCGLTTSLAAMAHGRVADAARAHPFGVLVFAALVAVATAGTLQALTGRAIASRLRPRTWWVVAVVGAVLAGWGVNLLRGWASGELPLR